jgi:hypothetical protein
MADRDVSLDFMDNYARIRQQMWRAPPKPVPVVIPKQPEPEPEPPPPQINLPKKMDVFGVPDHPLLRGIKRARVAKIVAPILFRDNVPWKMVINNSREKTWHWIRYECYYALFVNGYGYSEIARLCDRDHTSVMYGVKKWRREKGDDYQRYIVRTREDAWVLPQPSSVCAAVEERDAGNAGLEIT